MKGPRIDEIAQASARGATRRQIVRALGAAISGGIALQFRVRPAFAQIPSTCIHDSDCLGDAANPCAGARCDGGLCMFFIVTCIPGYSCCGNGGCCPGVSTCQSTADCVNDDLDPCAGSTCQNGTCSPYLLTCAEGFICCHGACVDSCDDGAIFGPQCGYEHLPAQPRACAEEVTTAPGVVSIIP